MISRNVMKSFEFDDAVYYRASCDCGVDTHDITIEFEKDKKFPEYIFLNFYKRVSWNSRWGRKNWFTRLFKRISCSLKMLFTGHIILEEVFILKGEEQISAFIEALTEGKEIMNQKLKEQTNDSD